MSSRSCRDSATWRAALSLCSALVALLGAGCDAGQESPARHARKAEPPRLSKSSAAAALTAVGGYESVPVPAPGTIAMSAIYTGDPIPAPTEVDVQVDAAFCSQKVVTENLIVDAASRGLKNVVLRLQGISRGKPPRETTRVTCKDCRFVPHVSVGMKGVKMELGNEDPVLHRVSVTINGREFFESALPPGVRGPEPRRIPDAGILEVGCGVHGWERAYVVVHTNPYVEVTDERGKLTMEEIAPGDYSYTAWHEQLGEKRGKVTVKSGQSTELRLEFTAPQ